MILSLSFVQVGLMVNDFVSFSSPNCIVLIQSSKLANDVLWLLMRSLGYQIWTVPIIYVFWPQKGLKLKESCEVITEENLIETETSINSYKNHDKSAIIMKK